MGEGRRIAFGTDGVRGVANDDLGPEDALRLGLAGARLFSGLLLVGRDTRISGGMLSAALVAGAASGGARVLDLGMLPTPGVAASRRRQVPCAMGSPGRASRPIPTLVAS